jgi:hypothetical protein
MSPGVTHIPFPSTTSIPSGTLHATARSTAAVDQRCADDRARRGGRAGRGVDRAGDGDLPAVRRLHEEPLGDAAVLVGAVADAVAVGAVNPARLQRGEVNVARFDEVGPRTAGALREVVEAGGEAGRAAAHEEIAVQVVREVFVAIVLADGGEVAFEDGARVGEVVGERGEREQKKADDSHGHERTRGGNDGDRMADERG